MDKPSAPPYPYSQPGPSPGAPPPPGYQEVPPPGMYPQPQPGFTAGPPSHAGYQGVPQPATYPQPGYSPGPPPPTGNQQGAVTCSLRDHPGNMMCPHCQQTVLTNTSTVPGMMTWISCVAIGLIGCCFFCGIPFLIDSCQDMQHRCPTCQQVIYTYKRNRSNGFGRRHR